MRECRHLFSNFHLPLFRQNSIENYWLWEDWGKLDWQFLENILKWNRVLDCNALIVKWQDEWICNETSEWNGFSFRSQSYQTLISSFFRFLLLSLSVCSSRKYCLYFKMDKLNSKKQKKSSFYEEKSLVGLTPDVFHWQFLSIPRFTDTIEMFQILIVVKN